MKKHLRIACIALATLSFFSSCRKDQRFLPEETEQLFTANPNASPKGLYLLNEGNMNANKASLDYVDFLKGEYRRNIYDAINPEITKGLGDVGNDIAVYGSKLYVVINVSNKVEVLNAKTGKRIKQINIINCRYITFNNGNAYVSAYLAKVGDATAANGIVAEIDTATLSIKRTVNVGRQPEELTVVGEKLYVANSGGYSPSDYERTISVIDINSFIEVKRIDVAVNLHRLKADAYGDLYVTSRGDHYNTPSRLYVIDTKTDLIKKTFNIAASELTISGNLAYIYSSEWNYQTGSNTVNYSLLDVKNEELLPHSFIADGTDKKIKISYGIAVNPQTQEVYVTDARDYVTPGMLYCFDKAGKLKWSVSTGDIPAHFAFVY